MLSTQSLKEILELVSVSEGSFVILEKDQPKLAVLDFQIYRNLVYKANAALTLPAPASAQTGAARPSRPVLVTGAEDGLAAALAAKLQQEGFKVLHTKTAAAAVLDEIFSQNRIEIVFHLSEKSGHQQSFHEAELYFGQNVEDGLTLLKAMAKHGVVNLVYASPFGFDSPFTRSKRIFEQLAAFYHQSFGINSVGLRLPAVALSDSGKIDLESLLLANPVAAVLRVAKGLAPALPLPAREEGQPPQMEIISFHDAVSALLFAAHYLENASGSMIYAAGGLRVSFDDLVETALEATARMIPTVRSQAYDWWDEPNEPAPKSLADLGWQARDTNLFDLFATLAKDWPAPLAETAAQGFGRETAAPSEPRAEPEMHRPVSLSELLSGQFTTPFIKPHSS